MEIERPAPRAPTTAAPPIGQRVGWLHLRCLAIDNKTLARDSPIAVVALGGTPSIVDATVAGPTTSSDICPALLPDRREINASKGLSFYEVQTPARSTVELGIAVIGDVTRAGSGIDISGDGMADHFTQCSTSEGVSFAVWSGAPYQGEPLWSGYYYLGYDTEATCPEK